MHEDLPGIGPLPPIYTQPGLTSFMEFLNVANVDLLPGNRQLPTGAGALRALVRAGRIAIGDRITLQKRGQEKRTTACEADRGFRALPGRDYYRHAHPAASQLE